MRLPDHPARRPTRYHWAAGLNPLHWVPALGLWLAVLFLGITGALGLPEVLPVTPWLAAAALFWSGVWLIAIPNSPRFKRAVDAQLAGRYSDDYAFQLSGLIPKVAEDLQDRAEQITLLRNKARSILSQKFGEHDPFAKDNLLKLDRLAISYLQLLAALSEYAEYISLVDPQSIEHDLAAAKENAQRESAAVGEAWRKQVVLLQNRLERYHGAQQKLAFVKAQCSNVEATMKLLVDQAMTTADPQRVGRDIDQVLDNIRESEVLTAELSAFDELEREIDDHRLRERQ